MESIIKLALSFPAYLGY